MNEFKFNCPTCGQHILSAHEWIGRQIACPSCDARINIPSPTKLPKNNAPAVGSAPKPSGSPQRVVPPKNLPKLKTAQTSAGPDSPGKKSATGSSGQEAKQQSAGAQPEHLRIAVLTPAVKLEMVRAVRRRIANESSWLPDKVNGRIAHAAKSSGGETVLVDFASADATRFSLIGAFLLEFRLRQLARTATGRKKFLDQEIPDAIREVQLEQMNEEDRERAEETTADKDLPSISHAQCLAVLEVLEERYSQKMQQGRIETAKRRLGTTRLSDLVKKLEKKARVTPEEVATALFHELMDVRRRLDKQESRMPKSD